MADFAYNNDLVFNGDAEGLSPIAQIRRTEQMLSSALKHGTTRHLGGHELLENPEVEGVEPLRWRPGDDAHNLRRLLTVSRNTWLNLVPEMAGIEYNWRTAQFENADGQEVTDAEFKRIAKAARSRSLVVRGRVAGQPAYQVPAGSKTLKRNALWSSLVRAESEVRGGRNGRRDELLARLGRLLSEPPGERPANLKGLAYSRQDERTPSSLSDSAERAGGVSEPDGDADARGRGSVSGLLEPGAIDELSAREAKAQHADNFSVEFRQVPVATYSVGTDTAASADEAARSPPLHDIAAREGIAPEQLVLHSDNGSPMKGSSLLSTLQQIGIQPSF